MDLYLPKSQQILVEKVLAQNKPTIIVVAAGSAINPKGEKADAIVHAWYSGQFGGRALANILFGKVSPSGKLPVTFYETADLLPDFEDYSMKNRTYRYLENNVLYPFGYGLTYAQIRCNSVAYDKDLNVATVEVENFGTVASDEVVQLYMKDEKSIWAAKNHKLCGFRRIHLEKGEKAVLTFNISNDAFEVVDETGKRYIDSDTFTLFAGVNQPDVLSQTLTGVKCVSSEIKF